MVRIQYIPHFHPIPYSSKAFSTAHQKNFGRFPQFHCTTSIQTLRIGPCFKILVCRLTFHFRSLLTKPAVHGVESRFRAIWCVNGFTNGN
ncbi:virulence promoting factor [Chryseolinea sp. Jin1]|uniref:Virulence promoting factor n=1 Tax=Chryseolinea lacunae TaxID=2801331 RepID=A0ABS1KRL0_9BACT|nr:virulence promoting factor [Chryseolinea lacunae]